MRKLLFIPVLFLFIACNNTNKTEENNDVDSKSPYEIMEFVFNNSDTCVDDYIYAKYIPIEKVESKSKFITAKYVRYHDNDSTAIVFTREYIRNLCLSSSCFSRERYDSIYGSIWEYYFPEADLGFYRETCEGLFVYSWINFDSQIWFSDISDGITVTSDIESVLFNEYEYLDDLVNASVNIYKHDEKTGVQLDHVKYVNIPVWDIIRCFYKNPLYGIKKNDIIAYSNEELTFIRPIGSDGWNNLSRVLFNGYTIEDEKSIELIKSIFMDELKKISVSDDVFVPGPEWKTSSLPNWVRSFLLFQNFLK